MNVNAITEVQMLKKYKKSGCISPQIQPSMKQYPI